MGRRICTRDGVHRDATLPPFPSAPSVYLLSRARRCPRAVRVCVSVLVRFSQSPARGPLCLQHPCVTRPPDRSAACKEAVAVRPREEIIATSPSPRCHCTTVAEAMPHVAQQEVKARLLLVVSAPRVHPGRITVRTSMARDFPEVCLLQARSEAERSPLLSAFHCAHSPTRRESGYSSP